MNLEMDRMKVGVVDRVAESVINTDTITMRWWI